MAGLDPAIRRRTILGGLRHDLFEIGKPCGQGFDHINMLGLYALTAPERVARGKPRHCVTRRPPAMRTAQSNFRFHCYRAVTPLSL